MLPVNFAAFAIASSAAFLPRNDMLLIGNDGEFTRYMTIQLYRFADAVPGLPMAPFEGMGVLYSFNPLLSPSLMPLPLLGEDAGKWLGFLICAALLFLSTYVLGCALGIRRGVSIFAAWILPPLCLPYQSWLNLYLTFNLNPLAGDTISLTMLDARNAGARLYERTSCVACNRGIDDRHLAVPRQSAVDHASDAGRTAARSRHYY